MLNHIILTVADIEASLAFYKKTLATLSIDFILPYKGKDGHPDLWGFGKGQQIFFWLKQGTPSPTAIHWGLDAISNEQVDAFYKVAIEAGATDRISPRFRLEYHPGYYAANVLDPDGYSFEVNHMN